MAVGGKDYPAHTSVTKQARVPGKGSYDDAEGNRSRVLMGEDY
jgi:hypothetical protein